MKKIFPAFSAFLALLFCGLLFRSCTVRKIPFSDGSYIKADLLRHDAALHTKEGKRALGGITEWLDSEKYIYGEHKDGRTAYYDTVEWTVKSKSAPSLTGIGYDE